MLRDEITYKDINSPQIDPHIQWNFNQNPNRIFMELDQFITKFIRMNKESRRNSAFSKSKNKGGEGYFPYRITT